MAEFCDCGKPLTNGERSPRTFIVIKPDGSKTKYQKKVCHKCRQQELDKGAIEIDE